MPIDREKKKAKEGRPLMLRRNGGDPRINLTRRGGGEGVAERRTLEEKHRAQGGPGASPWWRIAAERCGDEADTEVDAR